MKAARATPPDKLGAISRRKRKFFSQFWRGLQSELQLFLQKNLRMSNIIQTFGSRNDSNT